MANRLLLQNTVLPIEVSQPGERRLHLGRREASVPLQIGHRVKRGVVAGQARPKNCIVDDPHVKVPLMGISEGVVHADIGQRTDENESRDIESAQQDLQLSTDEAGVSALRDQLLTGLGLQRGPQLGTNLALDAVHLLSAIKLSADVDAVRSMDLLEKDDGDARQAGTAYDPFGVRNEGFVTGHQLDANIGFAHRSAPLNIDDQQRGRSDKSHGSGPLIRSLHSHGGHPRLGLILYEYNHAFVHPRSRQDCRRVNFPRSCHPGLPR